MKHQHPPRTAGRLGAARSTNSRTPRWLPFAPTPLLIAFAGSCNSPAAAPPPEPTPQQLAAMWSPESRLRDELATLRTEDEMRVCLANGLPQQELDIVGFDEATIAQHIERVIAATMTRRARQDDAAAEQQLAVALRLYLAAMREAYFRKAAGAAPCLPLRR